MAQQDGGWPLGLRPLSQRVGLIRTCEFSGSSSSFSTLITGSPGPSSATSSDLDSESAGSSFHDQRITLGSLIGVSNFLELSFRSLGKKSRRRETSKGKKCIRARTCFSLCLRAHLFNQAASNAPSLGHYLEVERRAGDARRSHGSISCRLGELTEGRSNNPFSSDGSSSIVPSGTNGGGSGPLFVAGDDDAKKSRTRLDSDGEARTDEADRFVSSLLLPCMGGRSQH